MILNAGNLSLQPILLIILILSKNFLSDPGEQDACEENIGEGEGQDVFPAEAH